MRDRFAGLVLGLGAAFGLAAWSGGARADVTGAEQAPSSPAKKPGSLTADQYYDILAFDLKANGVDVSNKKIDPTTAAQIKLH